MFLNVHKIISGMAVRFNQISAKSDIKGQFRMVGQMFGGFIGQRRKVFSCE
jgi:hypothetical protein